MTKRPSDETAPAMAEGEGSQPRRRTPTYMEAVRPGTQSQVPASNPPAAAAPSSTAPSKPTAPEEERSNPRSGVGSRTRIGLPPVTVLPGQARRRDGKSDFDPNATVRASTPAGGTGAPEPARVVSRETIIMGAAPRPESGPSAASQAMVVSRARVGPGAGALERVAPAPGGRRARPTVPPAEIVAHKHTVPSGRAWPLVVLGQRFLPQAAAIRSLRHRLAEKGDPRAVLVTSAGRREGKTFCAANLALALAEIRRSRVLLLEANLYHPSLASLFGINKHACFLEQLELHKRDFTAPWKVTELSTHDLHLLAIDTRSEKVRGLEGSTFTNSLDSLRGTYDYIVVDGPPVNAGPDVPLLEDAVDGILFTARADSARARSLKYALDQVSPQDLLGVVLMDM
jgi:Mrp family chromosome partitioning ATPase